ncbi:hypothetical protein BGX33_001256, partial [Mortierella sp. NVP41]
RTPTERTRGKEWEFSIPFEMVHLFHDKTVPAQLYHGAEPPHSMFQRKAAVVGWTGLMRTTGSQEMSMADFLDAHVNNNSEQDGQPVPPFFFPEEHVSGPDIVFVVRFSGLAPDDTLTSSSTPSPGSASSEILCPVLVQLKLCEKLSQGEVIKARGTVQPGKIKGHGVKLSQYCRPHGHYISLIVSYPVEIAGYFMDRPLKKHKDGLTEIALTIDDSNIDDLFSEKHVHALRRMKRLAAEMAETTKEVKRRRDEASCALCLFQDMMRSLGSFMSREKYHPISAAQLQDLNNNHVACLTIILPSTRVSLPATSCFTKEHWLDHSCMNACLDRFVCLYNTTGSISIFTMDLSTLVASNDDSSAWSYFHIRVFDINCQGLQGRQGCGCHKRGGFKKNKRHFKCNYHCICNTPSDCKHPNPCSCQP